MRGRARSFVGSAALDGCGAALPGVAGTVWCGVGVGGRGCETWNEIAKNAMKEYTIKPNDTECNEMR